jgi:hypothetical protein
MIGTIIRVARLVHESVHDEERKIEPRLIETPALNDEGLGVTLLAWVRLSSPVANKQAPPGLAPVRLP